MALIVKDRVQETSTTTGTGTLTLAGAISGFQTFSSAIGNGNTTYYTITNGTDWEVGIGTVAAGTLSRDTILSSSTGSAISFSAGVKNVFVTYPADKAVTIDGVQTLTNKALNGTLGATTPSTVAATTISASGVSTFSAGSAGAPAITTTGDTNTGIFFPTADTIAFAEGGAEAMRIDASGNVGVGVTPSAWGSSSAIQMAGGQGYSRYGITNNSYYDGASYRYISTAAATLYGNNAGSHLWFNAPSGTAGNAITFTQAMTLDSSGNLGIGTPSPAISGSVFTTLNVKGISNTTALITATSGDLGSSVQLYSGASSSDNPAIGYQKSLRFGTTTDSGIGGFTERMRLNNNGNIALQGATTTATGVGITFPATQSASTNANCLDDYEEGTFTPVLQNSSSGNATMALQEAWYIKVGNIVTFSIQIDWSARGSWTTNTRINGLPFVARNNTGGYGWPNSVQMSSTLTTPFTYTIEANTTWGYIQPINAFTQLSPGNFPISGKLTINGVYQTA